MDLEKISSVEPRSIYNILRHVSLNYYTASAVLIGTAVGRVILSLETGLQKTSVLAAISLFQKTIQPDKLQLIVIPPEANKNIPLIQKWVPFVKYAQLDSVSGIDGRMPTHRKIVYEQADAIFISPKLLFSDDFVILWNTFLKHKVGSLIIDESHLLANPDTQAGYMLKYLSQSVRDMFLLTATPGRNLKQFAFLCNLCQVDTPYLSLTRADIGIEGNFHTTSTRFDEDQLYKLYKPFDEPNRLMRYRENFLEESPLTRDLLKYLKANSGSPCLVYMGYLRSQEQMESLLTKMGYRVAVINSGTQTSQRTEIGKNINKYDVILSTVTIAIDIPVNHLFLFGWCSDIIQLVGRLLRTYTKKDIHIHLSLIDFELENVRGQLLDLLHLQYETEKSDKLVMSMLKEVDKYF